MKTIITILLATFTSICFAQKEVKDSISPIDLSEIIVIGKKIPVHLKQPKSLATVEEYLQHASKVNMIRRGGYALEPIINNMATERTVITIDGMRIFGACTDKMDPVTSYVEVSNLSEAAISSGQQGSCHGPTIGGAIDLKRTNLIQKELGWNGAFKTGYETNNQQKIIGTSIGYNDSSFYFNTDFTYRDAENYKAGSHEEINFSQFTKYNLSATAGFYLGKKSLIEGSVIYDKATDVGYPALPMDVSLAKATIASLRYSYNPISSYITNWETKVYFNTITHKMDDTKRPSVPIHMDMPGWSDTYGFYSKVKGKFKNHSFMANLNGFYNKSVAEMTMYPNNPNENAMFMYTWPDIRTRYNGVYLEDAIPISQKATIKISTSIGMHSNKVADEFGLQSLQIFYPDMSATKNRILKSLATNYLLHYDKFEYGFGLAYGERAPSVSEGYGYYLYNSNDFYDYVGNPNLKNEKSLEANVTLGFKTGRFTSNLTSSYFHIQDYIVGQINTAIHPMTIGASGVKVYNALSYASIFNTDLNLEYKITENWSFKTLLVYSYGKDNENNKLPFISPLRYSGNIQYKKENFNMGFGTSGNLAQTKFATIYGETETPSYVIFNLNSGYTFSLKENKMNVQMGVENIFDTYYTTFSDWNKIPRQGRNFFINIAYTLF
ncbi:TonB-dependent receptor [Flavobacterium branchiarum]|uniref:TonB-dependent receptor domain-containing protein n=1 Tax=Flavobacterium branchiarum TaxID=1114870 RepID=A0ABV5FQP0_9FLAO|nr:TonB-dependent receptor [Flavobacterium branchiarum]MDN3673208.1 TonB-dependent receptor [Flavobacterium branchiarum]